MRWPLFSRQPQDDDPVGPVGRLPRQLGPDGTPTEWVPATDRTADVGAPIWTTRPAPSVVDLPVRPAALARAVVDALGTGRSVPACVGVMVDPRMLAPASGPAADLVGRLADLLPGLRLLPVADDDGPPTVRDLDRAAERLVGVEAIVAVGPSSVIDAARVLAAGGRNLTALYAGRGGSQCLLPLTGPIPLVAVRTAALAADAPRAVVVGTDVGRLVLTGDQLEPRLRTWLPGVGAQATPGTAEIAPLVLVGRFLGPWHGAGLPAPQRVVHDVRAALAAVLDVGLDPEGAVSSGAVDRWDELVRRAARAAGPPGNPCAYWLWPLAHEWATIADRSVDQALADLLPAWLAELRLLGLPSEQQDLWHEAAISRRSTVATITLSEADLRIALRRVDRWWRPIGPGIPDAGQLHRIFGLGRRSTA